MASGVSKTSSIGAVRLRRRMFQNFMLILVDETIDKDIADCQNTLAQLRSVVKEVNMYTTPEQCIRALYDVDDGEIFVIASEELGQYVVPSIHHMARVHTIYLLCGNQAEYDGWAKFWPKIRGVFASLNPICEALKQVTREYDRNTIPMSFLPKPKAETSTSGQENLKQLPPEFMYSVLFKEIVLEINHDGQKSLNDFFIYCRQQNTTEEELKTFQDNYQEKTAVYMYSRCTFLYTMLNRALRTLETRTMLKMGFFIRKLHQQLERLHQEQKHSFTTKRTVYRGVGFTAEYFQQLLDTKGGLLSFNSFLSTTKLEEVALIFAETTLVNKNNVDVPFIIEIDPNKVSSSTTPYAIIDKYSAIPAEEEILFSMHTVFNVGDIKQAANSKSVWEVQLTLTDDHDPQLANLT